MDFLNADTARLVKWSFLGENQATDAADMIDDLIDWVNAKYVYVHFVEGEWQGYAMEFAFCESYHRI